MNKKIIKRIEALLATYPHRTFKPKELARKLGVAKPDYTSFRDTIKKAARDGLIAKYRGNSFGTLQRAAVLEGELHVKAQGYGFLLVGDDKDDVFISQKNMGTALNKDMVQVQLYARSKTAGRSREGRVVKVVKRASQTVVGTYRSTKRYGFVVPDELKMSRDVFVPEGASGLAQSGQKVVVKITSWDDARANPEGEIVEILGFPDDPGVDVLAVVKAFDLPITFQSQVEEEARRIPAEIPAKEIARRLDLRQEVCFTIDPRDAKDFDDAVSIRKLKNGNHELGVHIADVSYYVQPGSRLDREALKRGTSVYLVDRVIPMLPEKLSNQICSLRPNEDRLAFSCIMEVAPSGKTVKYKIAETVINSNKRFTYEEAQGIISGKEKAVPYAEDLKTMHRLSLAMIKRRRQLGSLDFDLPEVRVELGKDGLPVAISKRERLDSHRLVEEFMLLANQTVTEHVALQLAKNGQKPAFVYRIHEQPKQEKMDDFKEFVKALGRPLTQNEPVTGRLLGNFLADLKGTPEEGIVQGIMLRSMMKAKYSTNNAGHFGLAFKHYTHFTSPIRRYPDLVVHRLLKEYAHGIDNDPMPKRKAALTRTSEHCSQREIVALDAERESIKLKKVEYMQRHLGEEFQGVISGVVKFGIFVEITDLLVEGLVHISDLEDDYYFHDDKNYRLVGQFSEKVYRLGDPVKVRVVRVDTDERVIDFTLVE